MRGQVPLFVRAEIYEPGQLVWHDGRVWILVAPNSVTCVDAPGEEEYRRLWVPLDGDKWRKTPIPRVERRGWRQRTMRKLIRQADLNEALYMRLPYDGERHKAMLEAVKLGLDFEQQKRLRRSLGLTAQELSDIMTTRRARRRARFSKMAGADNGKADR